MNKRAYVFLDGKYETQAKKFYQDIFQEESADIIAVDGGGNFLYQHSVVPRVVLGDMDSITTAAMHFFSQVEQLHFPQKKDATDGQLAVEYAMKQGYEEVVLVGGQGDFGTVDHTLGNLFLLRYSNPCVRMEDPWQDVRRVTDAQLVMYGKIAENVSLVVISSVAVISSRGLQYNLEEQEVCFGSTLTLRNEFAQEKAVITVQGDVLVIQSKSS